MPKTLGTTPPIKGRSGSKVTQGQFALEAAVRIRGTLNCLFSLVPEDDLARQAAQWYRAYAEAALRFNCVLIKQWIRTESAKAAEEGFALEDFLALLRCCRQCVIDLERWKESALAPVDRIINEALFSLQGRVAWPITNGMNYVVQGEENLAPLVTDTQILDNDILLREKRNASRCQLRLPIRVRAKDSQETGEESKTTSVSRTGLCFITSTNCDLGAELLIVFPYWSEEDRFNEEYLAQVVRKESLPDGRLSVAIRFLQSLGHKTDPALRQTDQKPRK